MLHRCGCKSSPGSGNVCVHITGASGQLVARRFPDAAVILPLIVTRASAAWRAGKGLPKEPSSAACGERLCFGEQQGISCILSFRPL